MVRGYHILAHAVPKCFSNGAETEDDVKVVAHALDEPSEQGQRCGVDPLFLRQGSEVPVDLF
jgi:hypothetical protein